MVPSQTKTTVLLGIAQTLAWASSYYLPAILAVSISKDVGTTPSMVFAAFSVALLVAAAVGPYAGRLIDHHGGRSVLMVSNLVFASGLLALSQAQQSTHVFAAWAMLGIAMGSGLYEASFATAVRLHEQKARVTITGITLFAGFASTVGWPLSTYLESTLGWRTTCMIWALLHLLIGLPLNALLPRARMASLGPKAPTTARSPSATLSPSQVRRATFLMAFVFAATWFISTAMAAHLPELLASAGVATAAAVGIAALVGPSQVAGRMIEFTFLKNSHPLLSARLAALAHPLGVLCLGVFGSSAALAFAILHGLGNGILTIAIGTLPLLVFGAEGYGQRQGLLMVPARIVQAGAPFLFGLAAAEWGARSLWFSALLGLAACAALWIMTLDMKSASFGAANSDSSKLNDL